MKNFLRVGKIISLHGIKGEMKVFPMTDDIKRFDYLKKMFIASSDDARDEDFADAIEYEVENVKYIKNTVVLKVKGIDSIEIATKYLNKNIYVSRENAVKVNNNEFFVVDIIGLKAYLGDKEIGSIVDVMKTKANDILVIDKDKKELLVPMVSDYIERVDVENEKVIIKTIEGLI